MTQYDYDALVFIGRFQPLHNGHLKVIQEALRLARRVIILVGSANRPREFRNPFTFDERASMIEEAVDAAWGRCRHERVFIEPLKDCATDLIWATTVQRKVRDVMWQYQTNEPQKIGLIGYAKDHTSYYLKMFPQWGSVNVDQRVVWSATDIRNAFFNRNPIVNGEVTPAATAKFLRGFLETYEFRYILGEQEFIQKHDQIWANSPFPPTFNTADGIVRHGTDVLLIERKAAPGKGLLALPGGYLNYKDPKTGKWVKETAWQACIRELREETGLKVPEPVLRGSLVKDKVFDDPHRSPRGQIITRAFRFDLETLVGKGQPKVKGGDDAGRAFWAPIDNLKSSDFFEDHPFILQDMLEIELKD